MHKFDVEFSLSIYNRTGKYFIGKEIIDNCPDYIDRTYCWYFPFSGDSSGVVGRLVGRLQYWQVVANARGGLARYLPRMRMKNPLLHVDPFSVLSMVLTRRDAVICHDLGPLTHPELFSPDMEPVYRKIYEEIATIGPHVIFVSDTTQRMFASLFPDARLASQRVIYPSIRADLDAKAPDRIAGITHPFILTVGAIGARKNQLRSIRAYARSGLWQRSEKVGYVICGSNEPGHEEVRALARKVPGVVLLDYVTDRQLAWLYSNARGFVLPSLLEGFGMPVAEAMRYGLVPLVSSSSVLEEVAGPASLSVNPENEPDIAAGMVTLVDMPQNQRDARRKQLDIAIRRFSPKKIAAGWNAALREMAHSGASS